MAARGGLIARDNLARYTRRHPRARPRHASRPGHHPRPAAAPRGRRAHHPDARHPSRATTSAGWGSAPRTTMHLLAEVLKIAFADRAAASGDPEFVEVPVDRLIDEGVRRRTPSALSGSIPRANLVRRGGGARKRPIPRMSPWRTRPERSLRAPRPSTACSVRATWFPVRNPFPNNYMYLFDPVPATRSRSRQASA